MFGEFIKERRLGKGLTLRGFCSLIHEDPSNWSKVERGLLKAPQDEKKLKAIALVLDIIVESPEWFELNDRAKISSGLLPKDILSDEEVTKSLPMFFRTLRSEKPTREELERLVEDIRRCK